jgi:hypothetical protein
MKNNKNNKYFFNWASGTGGDFLIGMLHLLYPFPHIKDIKVNNHNKWEHSFDEQINEDRLRPFEIDDITQIQQGLNDMNPGELFQYHQFITQPLKIPTGTSIINLTTPDIYQQSFVAHLYNIKARTPENIQRHQIINQSTQITIPSAFNIDYKQLFESATNPIAFSVLNLFQRSDAFSPSVVDLLKAYHKRNVELLDMDTSTTPAGPNVTINTFQELCNHFGV